MGLTKHQISKIEYTKIDKKTQATQTSNREIIPMFAPAKNISAIDVSDMDADTREILTTRLAEYGDAMEQIRKNTILSFDAWMKATHGKELIDGIKWRSFIVEQITDLE